MPIEGYALVKRDTTCTNYGNWLGSRSMASCAKMCEEYSHFVHVTKDGGNCKCGTDCEQQTGCAKCGTASLYMLKQGIN